MASAKYYVSDPYLARRKSELLATLRDAKPYSKHSSTTAKHIPNNSEVTLAAISLMYIVAGAIAILTPLAFSISLFVSLAFFSLVSVSAAVHYAWRRARTRKLAGPAQQLVSRDVFVKRVKQQLADLEEIEQVEVGKQAHRALQKLSAALASLSDELLMECKPLWDEALEAGELLEQSSPPVHAFTVLRACLDSGEALAAEHRALLEVEENEQKRLHLQARADARATAEAVTDARASALSLGPSQEIQMAAEALREGRRTYEELYSD